MVELNIKDDIDKLKRDLGSLANHVLPKALTRALNKAGKSTESAGVKLIAKEANLPQKIVRKNLYIRRAMRGRERYIIDAQRAKATNLIDFVRRNMRKVGAFRTKTKRGKFRHEGVKANAWGKAKVYRGTWIGKGRNSGKLLVFKRDGNSVKGVAGPSPRLIFNKRSTRMAMVRRFRERFPVEMDRAIQLGILKFRRS